MWSKNQAEIVTGRNKYVDSARNVILLILKRVWQLFGFIEINLKKKFEFGALSA